MTINHQTVDVETFKVGRYRAILQRHEVERGVRYDVFVDRAGLDLASCGNALDLMNLGIAICRAAHALDDAQRRQAMDRHPAGRAL
ncbi:hypothetical protein [Mycobacterium colombiense]|uniref:Uncharacterized protein n=1 Tax=Mycobacterium colombiense TaxID=339268 RepID=A0A1A2Z9R4_9MYCO|nr:hypothetical protein [Mycobacterium colombiense]OBI46975.1 hypothetical protein A5708_12060 [Mycobacterium colombiense]